MPRYNFTVNNLSGGAVTVQPLIRQLEHTLKTMRPQLPPLELSFVLVTAQTMRGLNKQYHRQNRVTDVLSFSSSDIIICPDVLKQQARRVGEPFWVFLAHALVHGVVHAAGYHHEPKGKKGKQAIKLEETILAKMGVGHNHKNTRALKH